MNRVLAVLSIAALGLDGCTLPVNTAIGSNIAKARAEGVPILVYAMGVPGQIAVGGTHTAVPVFIQFYVTGKRTIRQIRFSFSAFSPRGDPVRNDYGNQLRMTLIGPGDFDPGMLYEVNSFNSQPAGFPGGSVACVQLERMTLTYADGQLEHFTRMALAKTLVPQLRGKCTDRGPKVNSLMMGGASS